MDDNAKLLGSLLERALEYGKTSLELARLKAISKSSDIISGIIPHTVVFVLLVSFILFFNLGLAFWLGEILGRIYFGFFVVAAFYCVSALVLHFFLHQRIKKAIGNYLIKQLLK